MGIPPIPVAVFGIAPKTARSAPVPGRCNVAKQAVIGLANAHCRLDIAAAEDGHTPPGQRTSGSWTAGASAARPRFRPPGNLSHPGCFSSARKRRRRSRSAGALQIYPPQTAIGRCLRTATNWDLAGESARPGCRFRRRPL